jgi:hypothetical protein
MTTPPPTFTFKLSPGEEGISESLAGMAELVVQSVRQGATVGTGALVQEVAVAIWTTIAFPGMATSANRERYMVAVYKFLRTGIRFKQDPPFTELVRHPDQLLQMIAAGACACDCDEVATLGAALLLAVGIMPVFLVVGKRRDTDPKTGQVRLTHVFYGACEVGRLIPFDPQERIPPGEWPPAVTIGRAELYEIVKKSAQGSSAAA